MQTEWLIRIRSCSALILSQIWQLWHKSDRFGNASTKVLFFISHWNFDGTCFIAFWQGEICANLNPSTFDIVLLRNAVFFIAQFFFRRVRRCWLFLVPLQLLSSNGFSWFVRTSGSLALNSVCVLHLSLGCCCLEGCNWLPPFFFSDLPALQVLHGPAAKMSHGASVGLGGVAGGSVGINFKFFAYPCLRQRPPTPEKNAERARKKDIEKIKAQLHAIWCGKLSRIFYVEFLT